MDDKKTTAAAQSWWNTNPFTYNGTLGVGDFTPLEEQDIAYFDTAERKYIKHTNIGTQPLTGPAFSKVS